MPSRQNCKGATLVDNAALHSHVEFDYLDRNTIIAMQCRLLSRILDAARHHSLYPGLSERWSGARGPEVFEILQRMPYSLPVDHLSHLDESTGSKILFSS